MGNGSKQKSNYAVTKTCVGLVLPVSIGIRQNTHASENIPNNLGNSLDNRPSIA